MSTKKKNPTLGFAGRYQFVKYKADAEGNAIEGTAEIVLPWTNNLITDSGLNLLGTSTDDLLAYCRLGSGNSAPAASDTVLAAQVGASSSSGAADVSGYSVGNEYGFRRVTRRFSAGTVSGVNLAEVAMAPAESGPIFSRALLKDTSGTPTTITLDSGEILDVVYEVRLYPALTPVSGTYVIDGVPTTVTSTPIGWGSASAWNPSGIAIGSVLALGTTNQTTYCAAKATENYTNVPQAYASGAGEVVGVARPYTPGTFQRTKEYSYALSQANFGTGIGGFRWGATAAGAVPYSHSGMGQFAVGFNPKIQKNSTKTAKIEVGLSWGRYTP